MRRDFELIRLLGLEIAEEQANSAPFSVSLPETSYSKDDILEHLNLMIQAGLIEGVAKKYGEWPIKGVDVYCLTWRGHDFVDAARSKTIWQKAIASASQTGGALTFSVLASLLEKWALHSAGIQS